MIVQEKANHNLDRCKVKKSKGGKRYQATATSSTNVTLLSTKHQKSAIFNPRFADTPNQVSEPAIQHKSFFASDNNPQRNMIYQERRVDTPETPGQKALVKSKRRSLPCDKN